jgi:hypothetical protein
MSRQVESDFERAAGGGRQSVVGDFWYFLRTSKKWWMLPVLGLLFLFGALMLLSGTAAAPFIYTLF